MSVAPRARLPIRALNGLLGQLPRASLSPAALIDRARRRTGLTDFGPDGPYDEALTVLCNALEHEAALTPLGRLLARQMLVQALACQLQLQDWLRREPAILEAPIRHPLVIVGMPRTGTSILHELLALRRARAARFRAAPVGLLPILRGKGQRQVLREPQGRTRGRVRG